MSGCWSATALMDISIRSDAISHRILTKDSNEQTLTGEATKKGDDGGDAATFISFKCSNSSLSLFRKSNGDIFKGYT